MEEKLECSDGLKLAYKHWKHNGDDKKKVSRRRRILCLHGYLDNCESFHFVAPTLFAANYEVVALDLPGHGLSEHQPQDGPPHLLADSTFYIKELASSIGWSSSSGRFSIVGHSVGGGVASVYAATYPEDVEKLVLLESAGPRTQPDSSISRQMRKHVEKRRSSNLSLYCDNAEGPYHFPSLEAVVQETQRSAPRAPGEKGMSRQAAWFMVKRGTIKAENEGGVLCRHDPRLECPPIQYFSPEQVDAIHREMQCPVALFLAQDGTPIETALNRVLQVLRPAAFARLPGGHHFHCDPETATLVCEKMLSFLTKGQIEAQQSVEKGDRELSLMDTPTPMRKMVTIASHSGYSGGACAELKIATESASCEVPSVNYGSTSGDLTSRTFSEQWQRTVEAIRDPFTQANVKVSCIAAQNPKSCIMLVLFITFASVAIGFMTNFTVEQDENNMWAPIGSKSAQHHFWLKKNLKRSGTSKKRIVWLIHTNGEKNLIEYAKESVDKTFDVVNSVMDVPGYFDVCAAADPLFAEKTGNRLNCGINCVTRFWNHNETYFHETVQTNEDAIEFFSRKKYVDDAPVDLKSIMGNHQKINGTRIPTYAESYLCTVSLPIVKGEEKKTVKVESLVLDAMKDLRSEWAKNGESYRLEFLASRSFADEVVRGILKDLPLLPMVFVIMCSFCCFVFSRGDPVQSRGLLGIGAVVSVGCAVITTYGVLFIFGVPVTALTQCLPFIVFGIGLDDAFIIMGSYLRTNPSKDIVNRIEETMNECGTSILITTLTSTIAFGLGSITVIPAVHWLCLYAFPCIIIDFVYQVTFFVAFIVLDERRLQSRRRGCLVCRSPVPEEDDDAEEKEEEDMAKIEASATSEHEFKGHDKDFAERFMTVYAKVLMKPASKVAVIFVFSAFLLFTTFRALALTQEFIFTDILPNGSYVASFLAMKKEYTEINIFYPQLYVHGVDFSDPEIQDQILAYVDDMAALPQVDEPPPLNWIRDFRRFVTEVDYYTNRPFQEQLDGFLDVEILHRLYSGSIKRDDDGNILYTRVRLSFGNVDEYSINDQVNALFAQRAITERQPANQGQSMYKFFLFDSSFVMWEFFSIAESELVFTTIIGVLSVSLIAMFFIPHWSAVLFVCPMVCMVYIELLGVYQLLGLHINSITYVCITMSVGLMVDYVMHVVIRFYESIFETPDERVKDTLETMGASILIGALTTCLSVIPLGFSSSSVFMMIFKAFAALAVLGSINGLIVLPVVLSLLGPSNPLLVIDHLPTSKIMAATTRTSATAGTQTDAEESA